MKRVFFLAISCFVFFSLFSGTHSFAETMEAVSVGKLNFSMSKADVIEVMGSGSKSSSLTYLDPDEQQPDNVLYWPSKSFAGYDGVEFQCSFDDSDTLNSINVLFDFLQTDRRSADKQFSALNNALSKYGEPIAIGRDQIIFGSNAYNAYKVFQRCEFSGRFEGVWTACFYDDYNTSIITSTQRLVEQENGYIDICLIEYNRTQEHVTWEIDYDRMISGSLPMLPGKKNIQSEFTDYYSVILSYTFYSKEQVETVFEDAMKRNEALNDDV